MVQVIVRHISCALNERKTNEKYSSIQSLINARMMGKVTEEQYESELDRLTKLTTDLV